MNTLHCVEQTLHDVKKWTILYSFLFPFGFRNQWKKKKSAEGKAAEIPVSV